MLRSILIGLDESAYSSEALELGIRWARRFDAILVGLGIVDEPTICRREAVPIGAGHYKVERNEFRLADARVRVETILERFVRRCVAEGVRHEVLEDAGLPDIQIVRQSRQYDLTMLGQQSYFCFETQDWPDETLRKVLRQGSRPVVTVPEDVPHGVSIVVAYDGSPEADRALQTFLALGLAGEDTVHVVSIHADRSAAEGLARQAAGFLRLHGVAALPHPLEPTMSEDRMILAKVQELQAHLLVMGAYGRLMWRELVFGSTTTSVLAASPVPIFLCR